MTHTFSVFAAASFIVATGLFGAWMLPSPPVLEVVMKPGIEVSQMVGPVSKTYFGCRAPLVERRLCRLTAIAGRP
jgi:hypothetical protein